MITIHLVIVRTTFYPFSSGIRSDRNSIVDEKLYQTAFFDFSLQLVGRSGREPLLILLDFAYNP